MNRQAATSKTTSLMFVLFSTMLGCAEDDPRELYEPLDAPTMPSPTNAVADDVRAVELGRSLFFDARLSATSEVSCASCHDPDHGFSDPDPVSTGIHGRQGTRHAPAIVNPGRSEWMMWDGRIATLWAQPIRAIENPSEMGLDRAELARRIAAHYGDEYAELFGAISPPPENGDYATLDPTHRDEINQVAANIGKAIAAYERTLTCASTRFDRYLDGEEVLTQQEIDGALAFENVGCTTCHSGPDLTDHGFHNIGVASATSSGALGRAGAYDVLALDEFSPTGRYSDDPEAGARLYGDLSRASQDLGAFKTPSLRGVGQRRRYMHDGSLGSLEDVLEFYTERGAATGGYFAGDVSGDADAMFITSEQQRDIIAFMRTLDCEVDVKR